MHYVQSLLHIILITNKHHTCSMVLESLMLGIGRERGHAALIALREGAERASLRLFLGTHRETSKARHWLRRGLLRLQSFGGQAFRLPDLFWNWWWCFFVRLLLGLWRGWKNRSRNDNGNCQLSTVGYEVGKDNREGELLRLWGRCFPYIFSCWMKYHTMEDEEERSKSLPGGVMKSLRLFGWQALRALSSFLPSFLTLPGVLTSFFSFPFLAGVCALPLREGFSAGVDCSDKGFFESTGFFGVAEFLGFLGVACWDFLDVLPGFRGDMTLWAGRLRDNGGGIGIGVLGRGLEGDVLRVRFGSSADWSSVNSINSSNCS